MNVKNFVKKHWYMTIMISLSTVVIILFIVGGFINLDNTPSTQKTNCNLSPQNPYISNIAIGSNETPDQYDYVCPQNYSVIPMVEGTTEQKYLNDLSGGKPYSQLCMINTSGQTVCDQTTVITDMEFTDMTGSNGLYKNIGYRCCDDLKKCTLTTPISINMPNPSTSDMGTIPNSVKGCKKMGLCINSDTLGNIKQNKGTALPANNVFVGYGNVGDDPNTICNPPGKSGYTAGKVNLYDGCSTKKVGYLCKKYVTV